MLLKMLKSFEKIFTIDIQNSQWNNYMIFLEQCFGSFATGVREDENGNLIEVCFCKGQQCSKHLL